MTAAANTNGNREQGINAENLFPLDDPEFAVHFRNGAKIFRHIFRRLTVGDWEAYYAAVIVEPTGEDGWKAESFYQDTASFVLYQRAILRVEGGYQTRDGRAPEELPNWPDRVPQNHRLLAIGLLLENLGGIAKDTFQISADGKSVSFVIVRDEGEPSMTKQFFAVTHHFRSPTRDHRRQFLDAVSRFPASQRTLVSLYDELATSADGYSVGGLPIAPEQLQHEMCCGQKLYAVSALFLSLDDSGPEPRKLRAVTLPPDFLGMRKAAPTPRVEVH